MSHSSCNKKHLLYQSCINGTVVSLGTDFFAAANFKGLWDVSFQTVRKTVVCSGLHEFFAFLGKRRLNRYCLWEQNLVFHM